MMKTINWILFVPKTEEEAQIFIKTIRDNVLDIPDDEDGSDLYHEYLTVGLAFNIKGKCFTTICGRSNELKKTIEHFVNDNLAILIENE